MICKIKHGQDFQGCLDYITGKYDKDKQAKVIMHSEGIPLLDNKTVAQIFEAYATKGNNNIRAPVGHYAYSFHKKDGSRVTDELIRKIVREHLELMGIKNTEFIMTRHYDTDHDHAHLMCSMVDRDGHVISTAYEKERNARICKYLTKKYGLYISAGKMNVNRKKLRGREKLKYQFYDKVMRCKAKSADWEQFDKALRAEGLKLRFHYNNVNGKLMGVVFTDGKYTFSGRQLDNELKLSALTEKFGDLKQITHENMRDWYEDYRQQLHYINDWKACKVIDCAYPEFDKVFPNGKLPSGGYTQLTVCCPICPWNTSPISKRSMKTLRMVRPPLSVLNCCATYCSYHTPSHSPSVVEVVVATTVAGVTLTMMIRRSTAFASITHILINPNSNVNDKLWLQINKKLRRWQIMMQPHLAIFVKAICPTRQRFRCSSPLQRPTESRWPTMKRTAK
ncbi:MAG: relaxase/mobilization nuclease domain-containing protein [Alloprevotella sp.]|nr:relaxase/mobilization nuclease domain-containing protein [Alloprevotella sp.]